MIDRDGWNALYLENHDQSRSVSRWGSDLPQFRVACAKMFATFMALQSGTVFIYQGQELGMINLSRERDIGEYRDLETLDRWKEVTERYPRDKRYHEITLEEFQKKSRDHARTPMQWDTTSHAGSSTAEPWQRVNSTYRTCNAAAQVGVSDSVFEFWASILKLRKSHKDVFVYGDFELVDAANEHVFAYIRTSEAREVVLVASNFRTHEAELCLPESWKLRKDGLLISNFGDLIVRSGGVVTLRPFEEFACLVEK
ncbi:hypothetical protein AAFC00_004534 [Neodothiora populina]